MSLGRETVERVRDVETLLVLAPPTGGADPMRRALRAGRDSPRHLAVDFTPDRDPFSAFDGDARESVLVTTSEAGVSESVPTERVSSPADLTGVGMQTSQILGRWAETGDDIVVSFDSLTVLLQFVDLHDLYRFLHVVTARIRTVGAHAQFYLDPSTQGDQTVSIITSLFQGVARYEGDEWSVRVA